MKQIVLAIVLAFSSLCRGQYFQLSDSIGHTGINEDLDIFTGEWTYIDNGNPELDSLKKEFIQLESIKKLNKIRELQGMKPLVLDDRLKPAALHNAVYNRYCSEHKIFQPGQEWYQKGVHTLTHDQRVDIPNFEEILYPDQRIKLLDKNVFSEITEELTGIFYLDYHTYDKISTQVINNYKWCNAHWTALTKDKKWDAVYFYLDIKTGLCVVILGNYKEE